MPQSFTRSRQSRRVSAAMGQALSYPRRLESGVSAGDLHQIKEKFDVIALDYLSGYSKNIHECIAHLKRAFHASTRIYILSLNHVWKPLIEIGKSFGWVTEQPQDTNWISRRDLDNILS